MNTKNKILGVIVLILIASRGYPQGLGIGVSNPDAQLEIETTATSDIHIRTTNTGLDYGSVLRLVEGANFRGGYLQYDAAGNDFIIGIHDPDDAVTGNDVESIRISRGAGNVGILVSSDPDVAMVVGEAGVNTTLAISGDGGAGFAASLVLRDFSQPIPDRVTFTYDDGSNRFALFSVGTEVIRIDDASINIQGNGVFTDNAFGPSEWVIGQAEEGDVVCLVGSKVDEDGETRAIVVPCQSENSSKVVGVIIPEQQAAHHGNPSFEYKDQIQESTGQNWELEWRKNHVAIELTGFRMTKVIGKIEVGDVLVSSGTAGHAMATDKPNLGSIIGKASQAFDGSENEKGMVWARIHLQSGSNLYEDVEELKAENRGLKERLAALESKLGELLAITGSTN
ncbi:MAG: hypothetical protein IH947_14280 [Bacteroidetes bacterium]|nr:hypothetical protein [Bacteroidota bacterium]